MPACVGDVVKSKIAMKTANATNAAVHCQVRKVFIKVIS